ncbi:hypothetical protein C1S70_13865 [Azospirillum argentinense]|uniref:Uncharacterized protein n=1 Tax=Azospirillum argentinense TaxID=2970906 RepID=A0A2K1G0B6_9PROT|nr:hypothetical protein C1S70_13865 [Azospirillum argentinense]
MIGFSLLSPLPSGERVARRAGEGVALLPDISTRAPPHPNPSPQRGEGICNAIVLVPAPPTERCPL